MKRYHATSVLSLTARHPARAGRTAGTGCNGAPLGPTQLPAKSTFLVIVVTWGAQRPSYSPICRSYRICGHSTFLRNTQPRSRGAFFARLDFLRREPPARAGELLVQHRLLGMALEAQEPRRLPVLRQRHQGSRLSPLFFTGTRIGHQRWLAPDSWVLRRAFTSARWRYSKSYWRSPFRP